MHTFAAPFRVIVAPGAHAGAPSVAYCESLRLARFVAARQRAAGRAAHIERLALPHRWMPVP